MSRWLQTSSRTPGATDQTELFPSARSIATRSHQFRLPQSVSSRISKAGLVRGFSPRTCGCRLAVVRATPVFQLSRRECCYQFKELDSPSLIGLFVASVSPLYAIDRQSCCQVKGPWHRGGAPVQKQECLLTRSLMHLETGYLHCRL